MSSRENDIQDAMRNGGEDGYSTGSSVHDDYDIDEADRYGDYWAGVSIGPSQSRNETYSDDFADGVVDDSDELDDYENNSASYASSKSLIENTKPKTRKDDIVHWLSQSGLAVKFEHPGGFFIPRGPLVMLDKGHTTDIFDWLVEEGFKNSEIVMNYIICHIPNHAIHGECFNFSQNIVRAPFARLLPLERAPTLGTDTSVEFDDDIPF